METDKDLQILEMSCEYDIFDLSLYHNNKLNNRKNEK